uniref:Putative salivary lipocalin n=1 Tax=Ixodes ricinus TaxID=34613 RepID=A0A0K8R2N4_IXORI
MFILLWATFLALCCALGKPENNECFPRGIEQHLLHPPNAWRLITEFNGTFYLVYHSEDKGFGAKFPCLSAHKTSVNEQTKSGSYIYQTSPNDTLVLTGTKDVHTKRADAAYRFRNVLVVQYHEREKYEKHDIWLLYTDYRTCAVLKSTLLGIQMWVSKLQLENVREVPFMCSLVYDLATNLPRLVVYDWKECPKRPHREKQLSS